MPTGERKDNGFVFLIVVEPTRIDVHYGVGLGLPALTAPELTTLNRAAEEAYQSTHSMDQALLTLVQGFDTVARNKYAPLISPTPTPETINLPVAAFRAAGHFDHLRSAVPGPLLSAISGVDAHPVGSEWDYLQFLRFGFRGTGFPFGGGRSSPPTRGGSGSGRSGRGN